MYFIGALYWSVYGIPWRITIPGAKLELLPDGLRLGPNGPVFSLLVPRWDLTWDDVASIRQDGQWFEFRLTRSNDCLRFSGPTRRIVEGLRQKPVELAAS